MHFYYTLFYTGSSSKKWYNHKSHSHSNRGCGLFGSNLRQEYHSMLEDPRLCLSLIIFSIKSDFHNVLILFPSALPTLTPTSQSTQLWVSFFVLFLICLCFLPIKSSMDFPTALQNGAHPGYSTPRKAYVIEGSRPDFVSTSLCPSHIRDSSLAWTCQALCPL